MTTLALVPSLLGALSVLLVFAGIAALRPSSDVRQRMERYGTGASAIAPTSLEEIELQQSFTQRVLKPGTLQLARGIGSAMPGGRLAKLEHRLELAGTPGGIRVVEFAGIKILVTIIMGGLAALRLFLGPRPTPLLLVALVIWTLIGFKLPDIWLSRRIKQRQLDLQNSLPDALDMLVIAVEAGLSFDQSIGEIVSRWTNEMSREFRRVLYEIGVGTSRREALDHLGRRTEVDDIVSFVVAINHAEEMGSSLGHVLTIQSEEMRTRRRQRAQERANKTPVKMMFPLVFLIFPSMFAVILGPAIPRLARVLGMINTHR